MNQSLRYISISHKTASTKQREVFHIPLEKKSDYVHLICNTFPDIDGLLFLTTSKRCLTVASVVSLSSNNFLSIKLLLGDFKSIKKLRILVAEWVVVSKYISVLLHVEMIMASTIPCTSFSFLRNNLLDPSRKVNFSLMSMGEL